MHEDKLGKRIRVTNPNALIQARAWEGVLIALSNDPTLTLLINERHITLPQAFTVEEVSEIDDLETTINDLQAEVDRLYSELKRARARLRSSEPSLGHAEDGRV